MIDLTTDGAIATITLNRPEKLNAFAGTRREDLLAALRKSEDRECRGCFRGWWGAAALSSF